ncbi:MAG: helix-turn-helix domain-containing protein [Candidatus Rokubacteria bacterium]|nr:helix-turn-helix domain-containing protein [Candidatus Rokubacteria bacterium]
MSSLGPYLRELRERRGVSLEEISRTTRVGRSYLEALESGDFSQLPAPVFTRGFILAYCQALAEPPDEALARFTGRSAVAEQPEADVPAPRERAAARARGPVLVSFVLLVVLGVALFGVALMLQSGRGVTAERRAESPRVETRTAGTRDPARSAAATVDDPPETLPRTMSPVAPAPIAATVKPEPAPGASDPPAPAPPAVPTITQQEVSAALTSVSAPYRLIARTTATTWLRVRTEDGRQVDETVPAGQVREWVSNRPLTLTIGNAGGVKLELNGRALPPLGAAGAVIRLVVPSEAP